MDGADSNVGEQASSTPSAENPVLPPAAKQPDPTPQSKPESDPFHDASVAHLPELKESDLGKPQPDLAGADELPQRRVLLPLVLFLATCASTFWVGCTHWKPVEPQFVFSYGAMWAQVMREWRAGLQYSVAVLAILLTHEMGHFLQTVKNRITASYPLCIPVPFNAIGTMGAVIGMDGMKANRREIFDIGIAGPLAGLVVAIPVFWWGITDLDLSLQPRHGELQLYMPWIGQWMLEQAHPQWAGREWIGLSQVNAYFMAGWVGMLITGLNMLPVSQLDGGHTTYALFLEGAHSMSRWFISLAIFYIVVNLEQAVMWTPMVVLVILMGIHHPKTADDNVELGPVRWTIGLASLAIPLLCFPIEGFRQ